MTENRKTDWGEYWSSYRAFRWKFWRMRIEHVYKQLLKHIDMHDVKILELGSGSGESSLLLANTLTAKKIVLVDSNKMALSIAKNNLPDIPVEFINKSIFDLESEIDEQFDIVHSEGLLEHFRGNQRLEVLRLHSKYCKPNGFVLVFAVYDSLRYRAGRAILNMLDKWDYYDEIPFTESELSCLLNKANLCVVREIESPLIHEIGMLMRRKDGSETNEETRNKRRG